VFRKYADDLSHLRFNPGEPCGRFPFVLGVKAIGLPLAGDDAAWF
jgi:hypothetical protein